MTDIILSSSAYGKLAGSLSGSQLHLLISLGSYLDEDNHVALSRVRRDVLVARLGITDGSFRNALAALKKSGAIEKLSPQDIWVNPEVYSHPEYRGNRRRKALENAPTALYRHFSSDDELLYVGISRHAPTRLSQHFRGSAWARDIARVEIKYLPNRQDALAAEQVAIKDEKPLWNRVHAG